MKKLFIGALALTMFTACSQDEIVEKQQLSSAITFNGAFVDNATRAAVDPSTTSATIKAFDVWAFLENKRGDFENGDVFNKERVELNGNAWSYANIQYWIPNNTYYFAAVAPVDKDNIIVTQATGDDLKFGLGTINFKNLNGTDDLLYDAQSIKTPANVTAMDEVDFQFKHLLSKVKFSFTNGFSNPNNKIIVKNIKMEVPAEANIDLAVENWWDDNNDWVRVGTTTTVLEFGDMNNGNVLCAGEPKAECANERLTIPTKDVDYLVTFDVELYSNEVLALTHSLQTTISGVDLLMGKAYNFHATLDHTNIAGDDLQPIVFDAHVNGWEDGNGYEGNQINTEVIDVASETELLQALGLLGRAAGEETEEINIKLTDDITLTEGALNIKNKKVNIDLNGKTLTAADRFNANNTNYSIVFYVGPDAKLTINGEGFVKTKKTTYNIPVWAYDGGIVNIYGGTYENLQDNDNIGCDLIFASGKNSVINIYGGTFKPCKNNDPGNNSTKEEYSALNLKDKTGAAINVYGGVFYGFDPAHNLSENPAQPFLAEGYISKLTSVEPGINVYTVYPEATLQSVKTEYELQNALNAGGTNIVLAANIETTKSLMVNADISAKLNLNGYSITNISNNPELEKGDGIIVYGKLEINGQGTVQGYTRAVWARSTTEAVVTINGGNYIGAVCESGCEVIYASGNGKITINGGTFQAVNQDKTSFAKPQYAVLNLHGNGKDGASISVTGGKFKNFDPANNISENPTTKGNFVAANFHSYAVDANWYAVVATPVK